ncbi:MAG: DUF2760 domain-containing protein [Verrucomicrobia bacterium]|nr:DUF2760 domain-containing protein [Verrucomicrobiota bacterium]
MKPYLSIAAVLIAVLTGLLLVPATRDYLVPIAAAACVLALLVLVLSLVGGTQSAAAPEPAPVAAAAPEPTPVEAAAPPPAVVQPPTPAINQAEAEVVAFFALLQEKGRLVDFLMEDLTPYDDEQVGAAARVVHQGCRQVLQESFTITPISEAEEGSQVTVPAGYAADEYRIVGKLSGDPPFTGKLVHKGWKTESIKLPRLVDAGQARLPAIAPAEVEVT